MHFVEEVGEECYGLDGLQITRYEQRGKKRERKGRTNLPETHLIRQNPILPFTPKISQPIQPRQLEILQLPTSNLNIIRISRDLLKGWSLMLRINNTLKRELRLALPSPIRLYLLFRSGLDLIL